MGTIKQNRANNILTSGKLDATDGLNNNVPATNIANASLSSVTSYPPSNGAGVSSVASDPPSPNEGQMWFNTTSEVLKQYSLLAGSWASGGSLNTGGPGGTSSGTQTSALYVGGRGSPFALNESYDGTSWTEVADLATARIFAFGFGASNTSALTSGGYTSPTGPFFINTETWNGTSWTETTDLTTARRSGGSSGVLGTTALYFGGDPGSAPYPSATEEYSERLSVQTITAS